MKRILLFVFILLSISQAKASDTLTLRQVYNFDVGDTFDYHIHSFENYTGSPSTSHTIYKRVIVKDKITGPGNQSVTYIMETTFPYSKIDTINYQTLDSSIISIDTIGYTIYYLNYQLATGHDSNTFIFNSSSMSTTDQGYYRTYTENLGRTYFRNAFGNQMDGFAGTDTTLVYFTKGALIRGIPYYNQPTGIDNIAYTSSTHIYPNPAADILHLSISNGYNAELILSDLLGQTVYSSTISTSETTHDISNLSAGIYTWRLTQNNTIIKTGKIVKQ